VLAKKFYTRMMSLASRADRGDTFFKIMKDSFGHADTPDKAMQLLEKANLVKSNFFHYKPMRH